jgi:hypothetical protein
VLLQADVDVDAVDPQVDVVHVRQIPFAEAALLALPGLGQLRDHRRGQSRRAAQELPQRGHEVARGQPVQIEQRQHLGDFRGLAAPRRQDRRGEPGPLTGVGVGAAVIDPRRDHLHRPARGEYLARLVRAVAHHQPTAVLVTLVGEPGDVVIDLRLQGLGQHPSGTLTDQVVDQRRTIVSAGVNRVGSSRNYGEHGSYLPDQRSSAGLA